MFLYFRRNILNIMTQIKKNNIIKSAKEIIKKYNLDSLKGVAIFVLITFVIHYSWRYWAIQLHYYPIQDIMKSSMDWMTEVVYDQSVWFIKNILNITITDFDQNNTMYFSNGGYILINRGCSGLKQITQFALLMMIYPGPWKKKLWYIPMGIVIVHLTNLFRVTGLSVILSNFPDYWKFSHDYIFRPFFYVVIFSMWVIWVEKVSKKKKAETPSENIKVEVSK